MPKQNNINDSEITEEKFYLIERKEWIVQGLWGCILTFLAVFIGYFVSKSLFFADSEEHLAYVWTFSILLGIIILLIFAIKMLFKMVVRSKGKMTEDKLIIDNIVGGTIISHFDDRFTIKYATSIFYKMLGYNVGEVKSKYHSEFYCLLVGEDSKREFARQKRLLRENGLAEAQYKLLSGSGEIVWVSSRSLLTRNKNFEPMVYTVLFDITNEKLTQEKLALAEVRNRIVLEKAESCVFEWDMIKNVCEASELFTNRFGVRESFEVNKEFLSKHLHHEDEKDFYINIHKIMDGAVDNFETIVRFKDVSGEYTHNSFNLTSVRDNNNVPIRAIGFIINVEEQYTKEAELRKRAAHDPLTEIYNKGATATMVKNAIESHKHQRHALLIIDVDDFKSVNDTLGHTVGDEALKLVSSTLMEEFESRDVVGRVGGDEFMVFAVNIDETSERIKKALDNIKAKNMHVSSEGKSMNITLSIGISTFPDNAQTYEDLYKKSDVALYESKHNGKDQYTFYGTDLKK